MATVTLRNNPLPALIARLSNTSNLLEQIGLLVKQQTQRHFIEQRDPDGNAWLPLSKNTVEYKQHKGSASSGSPKILIDTGNLWNSISYRVAGNTVFVGSDRLYGTYHQLGRITPYTIKAKRAKMLRYWRAGKFRYAKQVTHPGYPARRWLGLSDDNIEELTWLVQKWISGSRGTL